MQLLLINPNMSATMTDTMMQVANEVAADDVCVTGITASKGFPYISSRAEAQIAGALVLEMIAEHEHSADAVIIAAFGDPGLQAAREQFNLPVVGMAQAAIVAAAMLGETFTIVTFTPLMSRWYVDSVKSSGHEGSFLGVRTPAADRLDAFADQKSMEVELLRLTNLSIEEDGADVIILGGAPLAGMAQRMQSQVSALLVDPISCAVVLAASLGKISDKDAFSRRHSRPAAKSSTGLSPALSNAISGSKSISE